MVDAATLAMCCQKLARMAMSADINEQAKATWETGLEGKGLTSLSLPSDSSSSCQPGKVARSTNVIRAKEMLIKLSAQGQQGLYVSGHVTYNNPTKTMLDLNFSAA